MLNQIYERADLEEGLARKYGPGDYASRLGGGHDRAAAVVGLQRGRPVLGALRGQGRRAEPSGCRSSPPGPWAAGPRRTNRPYQVKNVYAGAVFPPGSQNLLYQGLQPDVFDPRLRAGATWNWSAKEAAPRMPGLGADSGRGRLPVWDRQPDARSHGLRGPVAEPLPAA